MAETSSELDRLSELPDHVRYQILSLLTIEEATATSLLSRAWKDGWLHLPCLDLSEKLFIDFIRGYESSSCREERKQLYMDCVDQVLAKRIQTLEHGNWSSLHKLCLYMPFFDGSEYFRRKMFKIRRSRVDRWLDCAVGCLQIKELSLTCPLDDNNNSKYMYVFPKDIMKVASSLISLSLTCVKLDQDTIDTIASNCPLLEFLCFQQCRSKCSQLKLSGFNKLIQVHVRWFNSLGQFEMDSTTLQTFSYIGKGACEIEVASCLGLKHLKICGSRLSDDSLSRHLAHLSNLQELALEDCKSLTRVKISNHGLKDLSLRNTQNKLVGVEIDAVNLKKFTYSQGRSHPSPFFTFKDFNSEKTIVYVENTTINTLWDDEIVKFMGQLYQCSRYLGMRAMMTTTAIRCLKEQKFAPLYYVNDLTIRTWDIHRYPALVDDVLSLFPRSETVLFRSFAHAREMTVFMLKLKYKGGADDQENCWWHQLLEVTIENIEGAEEYIASLKAFFKDKRATDKIVVHVVDKDKSQ